MLPQNASAYTTHAKIARDRGGASGGEAATAVETTIQRQAETAACDVYAASEWRAQRSPASRARIRRPAPRTVSSLRGSLADP